tara:strand:- start:1216 stop:1935 length:720 start_codon:yes stop_codon:yes gene_type:complete
MYILFTVAFLVLIQTILTFLKNKSKKVFIVEGNIGTGKTTFLKLLEKNKSFEVIYEPVNVWTTYVDTDGKNILEKFYSDFKRWAYTMQSFAFKTRLHAQSKPQYKEVRFIERSVFTDYFVFAHNCFLTGLMTKLEWVIYKDWFKTLLEVYKQAGYKTQPTGYIYLKSSSKTSYDRIKKRNRNGESEISLEYLKQIDKLHDSWLYSKNNKIPVLTIDCDKDFENDKKYQKDIMKRLSNFI